MPLIQHYFTIVNPLDIEIWPIIPTPILPGKLYNRTMFVLYVLLEKYIKLSTVTVGRGYLFMYDSPHFTNEGRSPMALLCFDRLKC